MLKESYKESIQGFRDIYCKNLYDGNMFLANGQINPFYNSFKKTGLIASILEDWWPSVYDDNKDIIDLYRPNANFEFNKVIDCFNKNLGCSTYFCNHCNDFVFIGHSCKSRACSSCGYKYKSDRVDSILSKCYNCPHRQIVFTIPKELRKFFFHPFKVRIELLFKAVNLTIYSLFNFSFKEVNGKLKKYNSKINWTPGFFAFLHTFGRDLKWNPHIHILIAELKLGNDGSKHQVSYFNYDALSKRFMKILLDLLEDSIGPSFKPTKSKMYRLHKNGFYVYAEPKKFPNLQKGIEYVTRYCGRVPISENRIINYDGENVTFSYNAHEDDSYNEVTISAKDFILMLLRHLIPYQFKIIRYYGFYSKKHKIHDTMVLLLNSTVRRIRKDNLKYRNSIKISFGRDPYRCPHCNKLLEFVFQIT